MTKRKGREKTSTALRRALVLRDVKATFRSTIDGMRREYIREREAAALRITDLSMERTGLRATIERQRELLSHPVRHLARWIWNATVTRQRKEVK